MDGDGLGTLGRRFMESWTLPEEGHVTELSGAALTSAVFFYAAFMFAVPVGWPISTWRELRWYGVPVMLIQFGIGLGIAWPHAVLALAAGVVIVTVRFLWALTVRPRSR